MTTKPSDFYRHCIRNGHTEMRALTEVLLTYLDEQHAAGSGEANRCKHGVWSDERCVYCVAESSNDPVGSPVWPPATPETGERAPSPELAPGSRACAHPGVSKLSGHCLTCRALVWRLPHESAPIAEPPSPVAESTTVLELARARAELEAVTFAAQHSANMCSSLIKQRDEARSQLASERAAHEVTRGQMETLEKEREGLAVRLSHVRLIVRRTLASGQLEKLDDAKPYLSMLDTESAREAATPSSMRRAAWLEGQAVGVEDTLRVIMLDRGAKFASHFRPIDSDLTKYPEDIPASPSEPAPIAEPLSPASQVALEAGLQSARDDIARGGTGGKPLEQRFVDAPVAEPGGREIVVGSKWREAKRGLLSHVTQLSEAHGVRVERVIDGRDSACWFGLSVFRRLFEHVSDGASDTSEGSGDNGPT